MTHKTYILILIVLLNAQVLLHAQTVEVRMLWDPEVFEQWQAMNYIIALQERFGNDIKMQVYYADDSSEARRQMLLVEKGMPVLTSYIQGRFLAPEQYWESAAGYAGVDPEGIRKSMESKAGKKLHKQQDIPKQLRKAYTSAKYPVLMAGENLYEDKPGLHGWARFINDNLPGDRRKMLFNMKDSSASDGREPELFVIEKKDSVAGRMQERITGYFESMGVQIKVVRMDTEDKEAAVYLKQLAQDSLPVYFFKNSIRNFQIFNELELSGRIIQKGNIYLLNTRNMNRYLTNRQKKENHLTLFVMPYCPFGVAAEEAIFKALDDGLISANVTVDVHYIVWTSTGMADTFISLHGRAEWEEAVRQLLIQKEYPDKFVSYLMARNKRPDSSLWHTAAETAGIELAFFNDNFEQGRELLLQDAELVKELGVHASPVFLWENRELLTIDSLLQIDVFRHITLPEGTCTGSNH